MIKHELLTYSLYDHERCMHSIALDTRHQRGVAQTTGVQVQLF